MAAGFSAGMIANTIVADRDDIESLFAGEADLNRAAADLGLDAVDDRVFHHGLNCEHGDEEIRVEHVIFHREPIL